MTETQQNKKLIQQIGKLTYEEAMGRLESIVRNMENGNTQLEDMILQFEEGRLLAAYCQQKLDALKQKVELLTRSETGAATWTELTATGGKGETFLPPEAQKKPRGGTLEPDLF